MKIVHTQISRSDMVEADGHKYIRLERNGQVIWRDCMAPIPNDPAIEIPQLSWVKAAKLEVQFQKILEN